MLRAEALQAAVAVMLRAEAPLAAAAVILRAEAPPVARLAMVPAMAHRGPVRARRRLALRRTAVLKAHLAKL